MIKLLLMLVIIHEHYFFEVIGMKKSLYVVLCVVLSALVFCGCGATTVPEETAITTQVGTQDALPGNSGFLVATPDETGARPAQITGFAADREMTTVSLPHTMGNASLQVISVGRYSGYFTEDSSYDTVSDIAAVVVQNISNRFIKSATVTAVGSSGNEYKFPLTSLPAGCSVIVLESGKSVLAENEKISALATGVVEISDTADLCEDKVKITFANGNFNVKNLTDKKFSAVYIRYKSYTSGNVYMGGVTYSATINNLAPYDTKQCTPNNFYNGYSEIMMVQIVE